MDEVIRGGIYRITCLANGAFYIGRAVNLEKRKRQHLKELGSKVHKNPRMQSTFDKYGLEAFAFEILIIVSDIHEQICREQEYIDMYISDQKCMNINKSALNCVVPFTEERLKRMSEAGKRQDVSHLSSPEVRAKIELARKERPLKHTEETRKKLSEIGRKRGFPCLVPESIEKRKAKSLGRICSEAAKLKISHANKGRKLTPEHRSKVGKSGEEHWAYGRKGGKHPTSRRVSQLCPRTGVLIEQFGSVAEAAERLGGRNASFISRAARQGFVALGFRWQYT